MLSFVLLSMPVHAQTPAKAGPYDAFVNSSISKGKPGLFFVDARTGLSNIVVTNGVHHTLLNNGVLFQEIGTNAVKIAYPDGRIEAFSVIPTPDPKSNITWVVSADRKRIAWAVSLVQQPSLLSDLYTSSVDGNDKKLALHTSSTKGIDTFPLAVSNDGTKIYYARQGPDKLPYQLFPTSSDVFSLDVSSGVATELPGKTDCACAIGFAPDVNVYARLEAAQNGFDIHQWNLGNKRDFTVASPGESDKQAGNILISSDGGLIVYTSARGTPPAKGVPPERYSLILVDANQKSQRILVNSLKLNLRAVAFEPGTQMAILVGANTDGTYKLNLKDGSLLQVSAYSWLGTLSN